LIDNNRQKMSYKERKKEQKRLKLENWPCSWKQINCNCIYVPHKRDIGPGLGYQCMPSSASGYIWNERDQQSQPVRRFSFRNRQHID
jgi:hypothetical protein